MGCVAKQQQTAVETASGSGVEEFLFVDSQQQMQYTLQIYTLALPNSFIGCQTVCGPAMAPSKCAVLQ